MRGATSPFPSSTHNPGELPAAILCYECLARLPYAFAPDELSA
jgi:hypothetical protein